MNGWKAIVTPLNLAPVTLIRWFRSEPYVLVVYLFTGKMDIPYPATTSNHTSYKG
jgi:hypothetical protein